MKLKYLNQFEILYKQLAEAPENTIKGGLGDTKNVLDFDKHQLKMGVNVESEHTTDMEKAFEIAMDHLTEIPDYYTRLEKMEAEAKEK